MTNRADEKAKAIEDWGADLIVNTRESDLAEVLREQMEAGHPVDVAIDCVGGESMGRCLPYLSHGARWIVIAALGGALTEVDLRNIFVRNVRIIGSTLRPRSPQMKAQIMECLVREVWPMIEAGQIKPVIYKVFPIAEVEEAQAILYRNENVGKVVMTVS